jgi:hypothetical protein
MSSRPRTHFAVFLKYRRGVSSRGGPPCSASRTPPSRQKASHALPPVMSAIARLAPYPSSQNDTAYCSSCSIWLSRVSTDTPRHRVLRFDQRVVQWMSTVSAPAGKSWMSCHVHDFSVLPPRRTENVHSGGGVLGAGAAGETGKPSITYRPGGTRRATSAARPLKPTDTRPTFHPCGARCHHSLTSVSSVPASYRPPSSSVLVNRRGSWYRTCSRHDDARGARGTETGHDGEIASTQGVNMRQPLSPQRRRQPDGITEVKARENRDFVRMLLARKQPDFARALALAELELECQACYLPQQPRCRSRRRA